EEPVTRNREVTSGAVEPKGDRVTFQQAETKPSASDAKGDGRKSVPKKPRKERSRRSSRKDKDSLGWTATRSRATTVRTQATATPMPLSGMRRRTTPR
ncbi:hypothetical protein F444_22665, partial [Phytophthora nicotianae P1976]